MQFLRAFSIILASLIAASPGALNAQSSSAPTTVSKKEKTEPLSWRGVEILKMVRAGISPEVILEYISGFPKRYDLTVDEIKYLKEQGVSSKIITAMLEHDAKLPREEQQTAESEKTQPGGTAQSQSEQQPPPESEAAKAQEPVSTFYDDLAPYGNWFYLNGYGWCWQPNVIQNVPGWRPYVDGGNWVYSTDGWYWNSSYSWGWAPFHYGRWWNSSRGWVWFPDTVWAPSWVVWRYSDPYCGWAPLPPYPFPSYWYRYPGYSHFAVNFGFYLGPSSYAFVPYSYVFDHSLRYRCLPYSHSYRIYPRTTVAHDFKHHGDRYVSNHGLPVRRVEHYTGHRVPIAGVRDSFSDPKMHPDRVVRIGSNTVILRPDLQRSRMHHGVPAYAGQFQANPRNSQQQINRSAIPGQTGQPRSMSRGQNIGSPAVDANRQLRTQTPAQNRAQAQVSREPSGAAAPPRTMSRQPLPPGVNRAYPGNSRNAQPSPAPVPGLRSSAPRPGETPAASRVSPPAGYSRGMVSPRGFDGSAGSFRTFGGGGSPAYHGNVPGGPPAFRGAPGGSPAYRGSPSAGSPRMMTAPPSPMGRSPGFSPGAGVPHGGGMAAPRGPAGGGGGRGR